MKIGSASKKIKKNLWFYSYFCYHIDILIYFLFWNFIMIIRQELTTWNKSYNFDYNPNKNFIEVSETNYLIYSTNSNYTAY